MGDQRRVILVGCGQRKLTHTAPARELYTGALFVAQRRYAEASGCRWAILSALRGIVQPDVLVGPYEHRLPGRAMDRHLWATQAADDAWMWLGGKAERDGLRWVLPTVEILAGADYADALRPELEARGLRVTEPLRGLTLGHRRRRLAEMTAERQAAQEVSRG